MKMILSSELSKQLITDFFAKHWCSPEMEISSGIFRCDELDGYAAVDGSGEIIGSITYVIDGKECEIISLDSIIEKKGIGTALLQQVEETAQADHTYVESLIVKKDHEVLLRSHTEIPMRDYSGGTSRDGSTKEKAVSFLERLDEHDITVEVKWKQGDHDTASQFSLHKKTLFDHYIKAGNLI
ncbi:GNAT family N-acetyltransferase [Bacillus vallismortis]|uniref:GNAT family N-acetyltransferase n=1 Tax=Bacillus vallismortis TaxID=72361 RepID=UPI0020908ADF|nr:GNAT family N-acetyltransferase [Bacillus vallismortis]MCO4851830.1 GNAT family N-acetyltransferase [Bacillus vallismortis]